VRVTFNQSDAKLESTRESSSLGERRRGFVVLLSSLVD